jgi:phage terminase Nu1 subunit (DNA packaging protein)
VKRTPLPAAPSAWIAKSKKELARFWGVSATAIDKWQATGMPGEPGAWDLAAIAKWKLARDAAIRRKADDQDPDRRLKVLRAKLVQLEFSTKRKALIPTTDHLDFVVQLCADFKNSLLAFAASLAGELRGLDEAEQDQLIRDRVSEMLENLSQHAGNGDPSPAAEEKEAGA